MRVIFLGTPDFARPSLRAIAAEHEVVGVVCQPDRPQGRRQTLTPPCVKVCAGELGLPVLQFEKIREAEGVEALRALRADIMVTCAYGQILTQEVLDVCPRGVINVHGSLLPKYRGAAPIQWAVINGERETGITVMQTERGLDCGDIILQKRTAIGADETAGELFERLSHLGADAVIEALRLIAAGEATWTKQDEAQATHCPMLRREHGHIDFSKGAQAVHDLVRGVNPWPCAYSEIGDLPCKVFRADAVDGFSERELRAATAGEAVDERPGIVVAADGRQGLVVSCGEGFVRLAELQVAGGKRLSDVEFLRGHRVPLGTVLQ